MVSTCSICMFLFSILPVSLYAMEEDGSKLFNIPNNLLGVRQQQNTPTRNINTILSELKTALLEEQETQKNELKNNRIVLRNTKKNIIRDLSSFLTQLETEINTEPLNLTYIKDILRKQKSHLLFLASLNGVFLNDGEIGIRGIHTESTLSSADLDRREDERLDIIEEGDFDSLEEILDWPLPENAKMWLNQAFEEKDPFWKGQFLQRELETSAEYINKDKEQEFSFQIIQYWMEIGKELESWDEKVKALYKAANLAKNHGWSALAQELSEHIISIMFEASQLVPYED